MDKKPLFGALSAISFISILFMPSNSSAWIYFSILGVVFGLVGYKIK